jgi:hypothetical protein
MVCITKVRPVFEELTEIPVAVELGESALPFEMSWFTAI